MNKKILITILIIAAAVLAFVIWNSQRSQGPQTPEEIQKEIERLEKVLKEVSEDKQKAEEGEVACILIYAPVCGANGRTYSNSCFAEAAGVEIAHEGECL